MINIHIEKGIGKINADGEYKEITADTLLMIRAIHNVIRSQNEAAAEIYRECIKRLVHTCFIDDVDKVNREYERVGQEMCDEMDQYKIWF